MSPRSTIAVVTALAATGCWPVIPGKADDYILPETSLVTGAFTLTRPIGGYWGESGTPSGTGFWGVFTEPQAINGVELYGPPGTCTRNPTIPAVFDTLRTGGSGTTRFMREDFEFRLTWNESAHAWFGNVEEADFVGDSSYDLAPVEFPDLGSFEIPGFIETPDSDFVVTSPDMTGTAVTVVSGPEALVFEWDGGRADWVAIIVTTYDSSSSPLGEQVVCLVEDNGEFTVPADLFQTTPATSFVSVQIGPINLEGGTEVIGGADQGYVSTSAYQLLGLLSYGTAAE